MPPFIKSFFSGSPSPIYQSFPKFYTSFLRGELEFLINTPFKSITFFRLGSSRAALSDLNNLFLASLFAGFVRSVPYLSINKAAAFQPPYSITLPIKAQKKHQPVIQLINNYKPILVFPNILKLLGKPSLFYSQFYNIEMDKVPYI